MSDWHVFCPETGEDCVNGHTKSMGHKENGELVRCMKWMKVAGQDPQANRQIDEWKCLEVWKIILMLENTRFITYGNQATETVRNHVAKLHGTLLGILPGNLRDRLIRRDPKILDRIESTGNGQEGGK